MVASRLTTDRRLVDSGEGPLVYFPAQIGFARIVLAGTGEQPRPGAEGWLFRASRSRRAVLCKYDFLRSLEKAPVFGGLRSGGSRVSAAGHDGLWGQNAGRSLILSLRTAMRSRVE